MFLKRKILAKEKRWIEDSGEQLLEYVIKDHIFIWSNKLVHKGACKLMDNWRMSLETECVSWFISTCDLTYEQINFIKRRLYACLCKMRSWRLVHVSFLPLPIDEVQVMTTPTRAVSSHHQSQSLSKSKKNMMAFGKPPPAKHHKTGPKIPQHVRQTHSQTGTCGSTTGPSNTLNLYVSSAGYFIRCPWNVFLAAVLPSCGSPLPLLILKSINLNSWDT
jgi:hypothetical protein